MDREENPYYTFEIYNSWLILISNSYNIYYYQYHYHITPHINDSRLQISYNTIFGPARLPPSRKGTSDLSDEDKSQLHTT